MKPDLPNPALIPFVVSITGHRDPRPQDLESLRHEITEVLTGFRSRMPHTPLLLLSGLAEGADQLAAEIALEQQMFLAAVLPMPLDIYRTTMSEAARAKLDDLLAKSALRIALPLEGRTLDELRTSEEARAGCYESLAAFLVRHGQALIALWDGKHSDKRGGTSRVVRNALLSALQNSPEEMEPRCRVVYQVVTPRLSGGLESVPRIRTVTLGCEHIPTATPEQGQGELEAMTFAQVQVDLDRFNREAGGKAGVTAEGRSKLIEGASMALSPFSERLQTLYGVADAISVQANRERRFFLATILATAIAGTLFYGVHGEILQTRIWLWFTFPFFVIMALLLHQAARATHVEARYLDARALAEALRVQFFWEIAGIKRPVDRYYLMNRKSELDWIRYSLKNIWLLHQGIDEDTSVQPNRRVTLERWVRHQQMWYSGKANQQSRSVRQRENISHKALLVAVVWSILVPASFMIPGPWHTLPPWRPGEWMYQDAMHVALVVPALLAAAYRLWIEQSGYAEQSREYRFMERQFELKAAELEANMDSPAMVEKLLLEVGIEALKENGRWLLLHRERPLEVLSTP